MKKSKQDVKLWLTPLLGGVEVVHAKYRDYRFPLHFHDTFVIQLIEDGADWCHGSQLGAQRGEVFVHFPFASHTGGTIQGGGLSYQAIYPSIDLVKKLLPGFELGEIGRGSYINRDSNTFRLARQLFAGIETGKERDCQQVLRQLLVEVISQAPCSGASAAPKLKDEVVAIKTFLQSNFTRDVTNRELSERFLLSEFHLIRQFKSRFGITPRQFLISKRIVESKKMLAAGTSVIEVAQAIGFSDQSHLTRQFKRIAGYTPGAWQRLAAS